MYVALTRRKTNSRSMFPSVPREPVRKRRSHVRPNQPVPEPVRISTNARLMPPTTTSAFSTVGIADEVDVGLAALWD